MKDDIIESIKYEFWKLHRRMDIYEKDYLCFTNHDEATKHQSDIIIMLSYVSVILLIMCIVLIICFLYR